jgi:signal transduction histidine kinase
MKLPLFTQARLKLTFWYVITIMIISGSVSLLFYVRTAAILDKEYERIERRLQRDWPSMPHAPGGAAIRLLPEDILTAKTQIASHLILINGLIVIIVTVAGYLLSGLTLVPVERAHEGQKRFIADAAHELKTPITAMKTSLEVSLMKKGLPQNIRILLDENLHDVNRLQALVQQLLRISNSVETEPVFGDISVETVVNSAMQTISPLAKKRKVTITKPTLTETILVQGNQMMLVELLVILLDNAVKYSPQGSTVQVLGKKSRNRVQLIVADTGIGIAGDDIDRIFDRFYRSDKSRSTEHGASFGLGLSIAKKIVEQHSGTLTIKSTLGAGTGVTVSLPRVKVHQGRERISTKLSFLNKFSK